MGQKSNLLTLRKNFFLNGVNLQSKNNLKVNYFLQYLKKLFFQKKIFLTNTSLNLIGNQTVLFLYLFFRTVKINFFKRKLIIKKKKSFIKQFYNFILIKLYDRIFMQLKTNLIITTIINLNKQYNKIIFLKLFFKFKQFHVILFPRRFNFFIDFLKITLLFVVSKINLKFYTETISQIFKILPKRRHNFFLSFMEQFFKTLIIDKNFLSDLNSLRGIKFMLSGRIQAKPRAKFKYFQVGKIPMQSLTQNIEFSKSHVYTIYGVFGLKLWTYKN